MDEELDYEEYSFRDMAAKVEQFYKALRKAGWPREDARQILPIGTKSDIVMTADFTEWRHVFRLRTQKAAHWEIRTVMCKLLLAFQKLFPSVFEDFVKAGEDENGVPFYKIKGYTGDLTKVIDGYKGNDLQEFKEYLTKKINE
jgi:thymidylate synthase (FAD)